MGTEITPKDKKEAKEGFWSLIVIVVFIYILWQVGKLIF